MLRALLRRVGHADTGAFAELYDASSARIYGLVRSVLRDRGDSEQATMEIYLEIWRTAGSYDSDRGSPSAWMTAVAHRRVVELLRLRPGAVWEQERDDPHADAETRAADDALARCLDALPPTQRDPIRLAYYGGMTYGEVAERLALGPSKVKSRMRDGVLRLKERLGAESR